jgi:thiol:disulfide interchange protein DsbG
MKAAMKTDRTSRFGPQRRPALRRRLVLAGGLGLMLAACSREEAAAPAPSPAAAPAPVDVAKRAFETAAGGSGFAVGQALSARVVHVLFDPQCPHCAALWAASKPLHDRVRWVWMPVAFINPNSSVQGALLLAAADPAARMDEHETLLAQGAGGLPVAGTPDEQRVAQVRANTALMQTLGVQSVPHMVWRLGADGPYGAHSGGLSAADLAALLGL